MRLKYIFIIYFSAINIAFSQTSIDSLTKKLASADGINKAEVLNALSKAYWDIDHELSIKYGEEALDYSKFISYKIGIGNAYINIAYNLEESGKYDSAIALEKKAYDIGNDISNKEILAFSLRRIGITNSKRGNYDTGIEYNLKALAIYEEDKDSSGIAYCCNNLGVNYKDEGRYDTALIYFLKSSKIQHNLGDKSGEGFSINNIGLIYKAFEFYDKANDAFRKSLALHTDANNKRGMSFALNNIGLVFYQKNNYDSALFYLNKSLDIDKELGIKKGIATGYENIGNVYLKQKKYPEALENLQKSLKLNKEINNKEGICFSLNDLGNAYYLTGNNAKAIESELQALKVAKEINARSEFVEIYQNLSNSYSKSGNFQEAYKYSKMYLDLYDSLFNDKIVLKIAEAQFINLELQKEKEIELLKKDNELQDQKLNQRKIINYAFLSSFILLGVLVLVLYKSNKQKNIDNKKLIDSEKRQKELNMTKDKFFSIIGHDLRGPLNSLSGLGSILKNYGHTFSEAEIREFAFRMESAIGHLNSLLENLLQWSRSQMGKIQFEPEEFDLNEVIKETFLTLEGNIREKQLLVVNNASSNLNIMADKNMLRFIIRNLLSNSIKYTPVGKKIYIETEINEHNVEVKIVDTGVGMKPEDIAKLFRIDVQYSTLGTANERGTGLGLILCKDFIEKNGGRIFINSEVGKGSTFSFTVPTA
jgi:signal transduction histidine kinase